MSSYYFLLLKKSDFYITVFNSKTVNFNIYNIMIIDINSVVTLNILNWKGGINNESRTNSCID